VRAVRRSAAALVGAALCALASGCGAPYSMRHGIRWDARDEIWSADGTQVQVRNAQSRVFDTTDRVRALEAVVASLQDLGFQIEVLDEALGIVSGKKFVPMARPEQQPFGVDVTYQLYDEESLVVFSRAFRTWGPFWHRSDLVRLTVTVRPRNEKQTIVRATAQFYLQPVEDPEPYQRFYQTLERAMFLTQATADAS
jgi:hypothetical protein